MMSLPNLTLVLGGVRSGKSQFAEALIDGVRKPVYIATAEIFDAEMDTRVQQHQARRGHHWQTIEAPHELCTAIREHAVPGASVLVDSLGMWLNNVTLEAKDLDAAAAALLESVAAAEGEVIVVSDELGLGGIADNPLGRQFADRLGALNQELAARAGRVYLVVAGLPLPLKGG